MTCHRRASYALPLDLRFIHMIIAVYSDLNHRIDGRLADEFGMSLARHEVGWEAPALDPGPGGIVAPDDQMMIISSPPARRRRTLRARRRPQ